MMEPAEDRPRDNPHLPWEVMASDRGGRQPGRGRRKARSETHMRAAAFVMHFPRAKESAQVLLAEWDEEIQALAAEAAEQTLAERVRRWRVDRGAEDANAHRDHG